MSTHGDGFFAVFSSPRACVSAVIEMQRAIAAHEWPSGEQLRVRMGVHSGEATDTSAGLVGLEVHRAARIAAVAHGGQILLSATAAALVRDWLPADASLPGPRTSPAEGSRPSRADLPAPRRRSRVRVPAAALARQPRAAKQPACTAGKLRRGGASKWPRYAVSSGPLGSSPSPGPGDRQDATRSASRRRPARRVRRRGLARRTRLGLRARGRPDSDQRGARDHEPSRSARCSRPCSTPSSSSTCSSCSTTAST